MNDVADVDLPNADNAIDRRGQPGVAELHLRGFDERLVRLDGALQLRHLRLLSVEQLRRGPALVCELRIAIEIVLCVGELRLIAIPRGGQLVDLRLVWTRIDLRKQLAGLYGLSFGEVDAGDLPLDLTAHYRRVVGDDGANAGQINRHVVLSDGGGDDRHRRRLNWRRRGLFKRAKMQDGRETA